MPTNYRQFKKKKEWGLEQLNRVLPTLRNESGIYTFWRGDETSIRFAYIGQAKHLADRLVAHIIGYSQRIDISIKKRGFYSLKNPYGWHLSVSYCRESELNKHEQAQIQFLAQQGYQLYNRTGGGQGQGKVGINDGQSTKGYYDGVAHGRKKAIQEVAEYFEKYLTYDIKPPRFNKNGTPVAIKERKLKEFKELLEENNGKETA